MDSGKVVYGTEKRFVIVQHMNSHFEMYLFSFDGHAQQGRLGEHCCWDASTLCVSGGEWPHGRGQDYWPDGDQPELSPDGKHWSPDHL